jgi:hypothetical protein
MKRLLINEFMKMPEPEQFAREWIDSWNSHDFDLIMPHYSDDVEIFTPMIRIATGVDQDSLRGKPAVEKYWRTALERLPDLHFDLIAIATGVRSIALYYRSVMNMYTVEVMFFDDAGKVNRIYAHYTTKPPKANSLQ